MIVHHLEDRARLGLSCGHRRGRHAEQSRDLVDDLLLVERHISFFEIQELSHAISFRCSICSAVHLISTSRLGKLCSSPASRDESLIRSSTTVLAASAFQSSPAATTSGSARAVEGSTSRASHPDHTRTSTSPAL